MANKKRFVETFDSLNSFLNTIEKRGKHPNNRSGDSSRTGGKGFTGTESIEEADSLLKLGWDEGMQKIRESDSFKGIAKQLGEIDSVRPQNHVVGFTPHVPNAILNVPQSMIYQKRTPKKVRVLRIYVNITVNAGVRSSDMIKGLIAVLRYIMDTERQGIRTELYLAMGENDKNLYFLFIKLKDYKDKLNLKKLAYPMGHSSMFRRHIFKWIENMPHDWDVDNSMYHGYGRPITDSKQFKEANGVVVGLSHIIDHNFDHEWLTDLINKEAKLDVR